MATRQYQTTIEPLSAENRQAVRALFTSARKSHVHLDWRSLAERLADPALVCWVARRTRPPRLSGVAACLGAIQFPAPGEAAWLRLAARTGANGRDALNQLWPRLREDLTARGARQMMVLAQNEWLEDPLAAWGFSRTNAVITLLHSGEHRPHPLPQGLSIRQASDADLAAIAAVDAAAFEPPWQHDEIDLRHAYAVSTTIEVAEREGAIVGYQLSTRHAIGGHLARLAVDPAFHNQGIGRSLVSSVLTFFHQRGLGDVSVNTQLDNHVSQRLYKRMGFTPTGHAVPIWERNLTP